MSMTLQEAAIKSCEDRIKHLESTPIHHYGKRQRERAIELERVKIAALRPITREQVEKVWRGEWVLHKSDDVFSSYHTCSNCGCKYGESSGVYIFDLKFCPHCGVIMKAEAVDMVIERLEALHSETKTD